MSVISGNRASQCRPHWRHFGIALLAVLIALGAARSTRAQQISDVRLVGNQKAEDGLVFQSFGVNAGDTYQVDRIRQGIRNLYRQGLFRDVRVEAEESEDGLILTITVDENPTLLRIRYDGSRKLKEDDFREVVQLVPGQVVSAAAVDQARRDLETLYQERGYLLARVDPELRGDQRADLVFRIEEGAKVQVKRILFSGNERVTADELRDAMETKEDRWYRGGDFKKAVFEEDKKRLVSRMGEFGLVDARISDVTTTFNETKEELTLEIEVEEGPVYRLGEVRLDHGGVIPEDRLRRAVLLQEGEAFNTVLYEESTSNLYGILHDQGYIYCSVDAIQDPAEDQVIDVEYRVLERDPARINRIVITGNTKTKEHVIRRELRASPGDVFRRSNVIRSQREVFQLGYFNDIQLDSRTADRETGAIDLLLNVEERTTGTASVGAGVNSTSGLTGFLQLSQNNFLGRGQVISVRGEFGRFRELDLSFTEPWLFGTPTSAGADLYDTRRRFTEFVEKRRGGGLRVGRPFPLLDYSRISASYTLANYVIEAEPDFEDQIGDIDPDTGIRTGRSEDLISSVTLSLTRNSVDSPFFPTRGSATRITNEFGGGILQGDQYFDVLTFSTTSYFRTVDKFVLSLKGTGGLLFGLDSPDEVPFWKRFRLGGISRYGLRGYEDFDIVPDESLQSTGGRSMMTVTAEIRYPIVQAVQALAFFDAGNTWAQPMATDLTDLKRGAGFGVRIDVPMVGQLGFDYGYGFDRSALQGGPGWEFHFQLGGVSF